MPTTRRLLGLEQKRKRQNMKRKGKGGAPKTITDERFASAQSDPRFMEAPKRHSKVTIDSRFQAIFTDRNFASSRAPVDKRGKPKIDNTSTSIARYYRLDQQQNDEEVDADNRAQAHQIVDKNLSESESESESEGDDVDVDRQSVDESSSTSTTDSDDDDDFGEEEEEDTFLLQFVQEDNVPEIDKATRRLAIVKLDWSQVRAVDLYVLLTSFLPKDGKIMSVSVYPSEFGLERMREEAVRGPVGLFDDEDEHDDRDGDEIDPKKLRDYELSRLRYYYAVVECDSVATSDYLYRTCDGVEFERSANTLDLRFIPDSIEFKHEPRDVATEAPADYEGLDFQTRALQHSNIHLTWDEDDPQRVKTMKRKLNDEQIAELELKEYLASDESESDQDNDDNGAEDDSEKKSKKRDKYRALIQSGNDSNEDEDNDNDQDMEVTFNSGLEEISKRIIEKKNKKSETVWDAYLRKRKEKKKASKKGSKYSSDEDDSDRDPEPGEEPDDFFLDDDKPNSLQKKKAKKSSVETVQETEASKAELELLTADDKWEDSNLKGYNLKPKKRKGKKGEAISDDGKIPTVDIKEDPRFSALFTSPLYARDPTDPEFKRSAPYHAQQNNKKQKKSSR